MNARNSHERIPPKHSRFHSEQISFPRFEMTQEATLGSFCNRSHTNRIKNDASKKYILVFSEF